MSFSKSQSRRTLCWLEKPNSEHTHATAPYPDPCGRQTTRSDLISVSCAKNLLPNRKGLRQAPPAHGRNRVRDLPRTPAGMGQAIRKERSREGSVQQAEMQKSLVRGGFLRVGWQSHNSRCSKRTIKDTHTELLGMNGPTKPCLSNHHIAFQGSFMDSLPGFLAGILAVFFSVVSSLG